uniref:M24 family metallopeptidase C-terminal domain-containing protein n=1 Tax=Eisenbergiella sp. TaxID=1924109 RepID=UPI003AB57090
MPIDLDAVEKSLMTERDVKLLNEYHKQVYEKIGPHLTEDEREWLKEATAAI